MGCHIAAIASPFKHIFCENYESIMKTKNFEHNYLSCNLSCVACSCNIAIVFCAVYFITSCSLHNMCIAI